MNDYWLVVTLASSWPKTEVEENRTLVQLLVPGATQKRRSTPSTWSTKLGGRRSGRSHPKVGRPRSLNVMMLPKKNQKKLKIIICIERTMLSRCSKTSILMSYLPSLRTVCSILSEVVIWIGRWWAFVKTPPAAVPRSRKIVYRIDWKSHSSIMVNPIWIMNPIMIGFRIWIRIRSCNRISPKNPQSNWSCDSETWHIMLRSSGRFVNRRCGNVVICGN